MARVMGIIPLKGSIGDITFFSKNGKSYARQKRQSNKKEFQQKKSYEGSRRSCAEFGTASAFGGSMRRGLYPLICHLRAGYFPSRLTGLLRKVLKEDSRHELGERKVLDGNLNLLKGLEVAAGARVSNLLVGKPTVQVDRGLAEVSIGFGSVSRLDSKYFPEGATHYRLVTGVMLIGANSKRKARLICPDLIGQPFVRIGELFGQEERRLSYVQQYAQMACFAVVGLYFYQQVNGGYAELRTGSALQVLHVEKLVREDLPRDEGKNWRDWIEGLVGIFKRER